MWQFASLTKVLQLESEHTPNPVIQRVKVVMSAGLMLVHTLRRWPLSADVTDEMGFGQAGGAAGGQLGDNIDSSMDHSSGSLLGSLTNTGTEQILVIGFVCVLAIKYIFFENINNEQVPNKQNQQQQYSQRTFSEKMENKESDAQADAQMIEGESKDLLAKDDSESTSGISESCSNTTSSSPSSTRPTTPTTSSSTNGDDIDNVPRMGKPATPSILITTQDSDTESVIAEYHRKINESRSTFHQILSLSYFDLISVLFQCFSPLPTLRQHPLELVR